MDNLKSLDFCEAVDAADHRTCFVPSIGAGLDDCFVVLVDPVAKDVASQKRPYVFDGVELRSMGRQRQQRDIIGNLEFG